MPFIDRQADSHKIPLRATAREQGLHPKLIWMDGGQWCMQDQHDSGIWIWDHRTQRWHDASPPDEWMEATMR